MFKKNQLLMLLLLGTVAAPAFGMDLDKNKQSTLITEKVVEKKEEEIEEKEEKITAKNFFKDLKTSKIEVKEEEKIEENNEEKNEEKKEEKKEENKFVQCYDANKVIQKLSGAKNIKLTATLGNKAEKDKNLVYNETTKQIYVVELADSEKDCFAENVCALSNTKEGCNQNSIENLLNGTGYEVQTVNSKTKDAVTIGKDSYITIVPKSKKVQLVRTAGWTFASMAFGFLNGVTLTNKKFYHPYWALSTTGLTSALCGGIGNSMKLKTENVVITLAGFAGTLAGHLLATKLFNKKIADPFKSNVNKTIKLTPSKIPTPIKLNNKR